MSVSKTTSGRWRARVKSGRVDVASRVFDRKRDAEEWESAQRRALDLGDFIDPRAGRETVASAWARWQETRLHSVSNKTLAADATAYKHLPKPLRNRPISSVTSAHLTTLWGVLLGKLARSSVVRVRAVCAAFLGWAMRENLVSHNAALESRVPNGTGARPVTEIYPFTLAELREVHTAAVDIAEADTADIVLVLGLTGLRWGELCALRVRDVQRVPVPSFRIVRSKSDGQGVKTTKSGRARSVPLVDEVWKIVRPRLDDRTPDDLLFPSKVGGHLDGGNWKRSMHWDVIGRGRRVHDLRHTAATLWLAQGVDLKTAQQWLGHASGELTVNLYGHYLGKDADAAAVARLNNAFRGDTGGTRPIPESETRG